MNSRSVLVAAGLVLFGCSGDDPSDSTGQTATGSSSSSSASSASAATSSGSGGDGGGNSGGGGKGADGGGGGSTIDCDPGLGDCDGDPANGCETSLTGNIDHCGACNNVCTGWCDQLACKNMEIIADNQHLLSALALDPNNVFWISSESSNASDDKYIVQKSTKSGGAATVLAFNMPSLTNIAVSSQGVYFSEYDKIHRIDSNGGGLVQFSIPAYYPGLVLADQRLYWTMSYSTTGYVYWKSEGAAPSDANTTLATEPWSYSTAGGLRPLSGDQGYLYYGLTSDDGEFIVKIASNGCCKVSMIQTAGKVLELVAYGGYVYYVEADPDPTISITSISRIPEGIGPPVSLVNDGSNNRAIAIDSTGLYFMQKDATTGAPLGLKRASSTDGSGAMVLVPGISSYCTVLDQTHAYFTTINQVVRVAK